MISKEEFKKLVETVSERTGKNQEELALDMSYGKNYISEMTSPTGKISSKFVSAFKLQYRDYLENPNNKGVEENIEKVGKKLKKSFNNNMLDKFLEGHLKLIDAAAAQAAANKVKADAELVREKNYASLIDENKEFAKMIVPTASFSPGSSLGEAPNLAEILGSLALAGCGKTWQTVEEGEAILHSYLFGSKKEASKAGTRGR